VLRSQSFDPSRRPTPEEDLESFACKINRALASRPISITKNATIADWSHWGPDRKLVILHEGTIHWTAFPGNENTVGNVLICADPMGLQWIRYAYAGKPLGLAAITNLQRRKTAYIKRLKQMRRVRRHAESSNLVLLAVLLEFERVVAIVAVNNEQPVPANIAPLCMLIKVL
jgi:hypothetical protein